jgi:hypothetical protein
MARIVISVRMLVLIPVLQHTARVIAPLPSAIPDDKYCFMYL